MLVETCSAETCSLKRASKDGTVLVDLRWTVTDSPFPSSVVRDRVKWQKASIKDQCWSPSAWARKLSDVLSMRLPQDPPIYWRYVACCVLSMWSPRGPTTILIARRHCSAIAARWHVAKNNILQRWMNDKGYKRVMNYRRLVNYLKENYYKKILINGRLLRRRILLIQKASISRKR